VGGCPVYYSKACDWTAPVTDVFGCYTPHSGRSPHSNYGTLGSKDEGKWHRWRRGSEARIWRRAGVAVAFTNKCWGRQKDVTLESGGLWIKARGRQSGVKYLSSFQKTSKHRQLAVNNVRDWED